MGWLHKLAVDYLYATCLDYYHYQYDAEQQNNEYEFTADQKYMLELLLPSNYRQETIELVQ